MKKVYFLKMPFYQNEERQYPSYNNLYQDLNNGLWYIGKEPQDSEEIETELISYNREKNYQSIVMFSHYQNDLDFMKFDHNKTNFYRK